MFPTHEFQKAKEYSILVTVDKEMNNIEIPHIPSKQNAIQRAKKLTNFDTEMLHKF